MRFALILIACLCAPCAAQELGKADPAIQERISETYSAFGPNRFEPVEASLQELDAVEDKGELVRQLAIFAAKPGDEQQPLAAVVILGRLRIPPKVAIRALAPYLETEDRRLRGFVLDYFPRSDEDYLDYVRSMVRKGEELPAPFIKYIFKRSPGQAMLVLQRGTADAKANLQAVRTMIEARQQGRELTQEERDGIKKTQDESERKGHKRREILLAEHLVSNALWLKKNRFHIRFGVALPEVKEHLAALSKDDQWWARYYVAEIMRQHHELQIEAVLVGLQGDENDLVRDAALGVRIPLSRK